MSFSYRGVCMCVVGNIFFPLYSSCEKKKKKKKVLQAVLVQENHIEVGHGFSRGVEFGQEVGIGQPAGHAGGFIDGGGVGSRYHGEVQLGADVAGGFEVQHG